MSAVAAGRNLRCVESSLRAGARALCEKKGSNTVINERLSLLGSSAMINAALCN